MDNCIADCIIWYSNSYEKQRGKLNNLKGKTICAYCNGGYRGNIGADELSKAGFKAVTIGGYAARRSKERQEIDILLKALFGHYEKFHEREHLT